MVYCPEGALCRSINVWRADGTVMLAKHVKQHERDAARRAHVL